MRSLVNDHRHNALTARRLCLNALLLGVALMLSYLEGILPLHLLLPLPGFRFGWAQLAVTLIFFHVGRSDAAAVSFLRVLVMGLLFGNVTSVWFSACGSLLSYVGLLLGQAFLRRQCSYVGLGVLCATLHNVGQILAATVLFGSGIILSYLPVLLLAAVLFGGLGGWMLNIVARRMPMRKGGVTIAR